MPRTLLTISAGAGRLFLSLLLVLLANARLVGQIPVDLHLERARTDEAQQNYAAAEEEYKQALEISPANLEVLKRLGILYQTEAKLQDSLELFQKVLASHPDYPQTNFFAGVSYYALNNNASAIRSFERELATPHPHPKCRYYLALALEAEGRTGEAITQLDTLVAENPKQADALYELARIHKNASLRAIQMLHDLDPDSFQLHALMGEVYADNERYAEAAREYEAALAKRPDAPGIHHALGIAYWVLHHYAEAENQFLLALKEDPNDAMTNLYLGDIAVKQGRYQEALEFLQRAETGQPRMEEIHLVLGKCYHGMNQPDKAKEELLMASAEAPNDAKPHYVLAQLYREANDVDSSNREMAIFERLSKSDHETRSADPERAF
jgi:tetratricopeptide (TPR) repeat protein